jgi:hypothetical protein
MSHLIPNLKCHIESGSPFLFKEVIEMETYYILEVKSEGLEILSDVLNGKFIFKETSYSLGIGGKMG